MRLVAENVVSIVFFNVIFSMTLPVALEYFGLARKSFHGLSLLASEEGPICHTQLPCHPWQMRISFDVFSVSEHPCGHLFATFLRLSHMYIMIAIPEAWK